ncbi:MAG: FAD-dependent monooxygenase [Pseudomonadales bacterium]|jgi:ubiquinone biosynthesis UbiH/UbiF/VisC/COQ6 family hydroxylase
MPDFDAIITGGGIVGSSAALCLARRDRHVLLVDSKVPQTPGLNDEFDIRTVALSPRSMNLLESFDSMADVRRGPIKRIRVWEREGTAAVVFDANEIGAEVLAEVVEVSALVRRLWTSLVDRIEVRAPSTIEAVECYGDAVELVIDKDVVSAACLVVAEGRESSTLKQLGISAQNFGSMGRAIGTVAKTVDPHNGGALQHFGDGILAFLPLPEKRSISVVWSLPTGRYDQLLTLDGRAFAAALTHESESVLGEVAEVGERVGFPFGQSLVSDFNPMPRVLVIGDAARTVHPLAGQGVNLGLEDVQGIQQVARHIKGDMGEDNIWRRFAIRRRARSRMMLQLMDFFDRTYGASGPYGRWARNLGVRTVNKVPALKYQLMREAMGLGPLATLY